MKGALFLVMRVQFRFRFAERQVKYRVNTDWLQLIAKVLECLEGLGKATVDADACCMLFKY